jgi:hypothetical protein
MKKATSIAVFVLAFCLVAGHAPAKGKKKKIVIIEGTILAISPLMPPGAIVSPGVVSQYRLVKYKVARVCKGRYEGDEIVIDHLILSGKELADRKVGDRVYVGAWKTNEAAARRNYPGIREASDNISEFYDGGNVVMADSQPCSYNEQELLFVKK